MARVNSRLGPLAEAHTSLGHAKLHSLEWDEAERRFRTAIELAPGYATAHFYYANFLSARGRFDESIAEARQALTLDPVSLVAEANLGVPLYNAGRYEEATVICRKALYLHPGNARFHEDLGRILLAQGALADSIAALTQAVTLSQRSTRYLSSLGHALGVAGHKYRARDILAELSTISQQRYVGAFDFALVYAGMDDRPQAIRSLERAYEERDPHLPFLKVDPRRASLQADPPFLALLTRVGL